MGDSMGDVRELFPGDDGGLTLPVWVDRLRTYFEAQGDVEAFRSARIPEGPWPEFDNPMVGYLIDRGCELAGSEGIKTAMAWAVAHAWFEAAVHERSM